MKKDDTAEGFLVTGFPRDIEQAAAFEERYNLFVKNENFNILHFFSWYIFKASSKPEF